MRRSRCRQASTCRHTRFSSLHSKVGRWARVRRADAHAGHTDDVLGVALVPNNKHVATISADRSIRLWRTDELRGASHSFVRINVEYDHASNIAFTVDSKYSRDRVSAQAQRTQGVSGVAGGQ